MPGRYIKPGYVFTSRGCPRRCWFCSVWKRDPVPRLLPIIDGWKILDDNLLACPREHVEAVFAMLRRQGRRIEFTGGLEALSLQDYQVELLASLRPRPSMFFAYDPGEDTFAAAEQRLQQMLAIGFTPHAMLWRPETPSQMKYAPEESWRAFQREWARPAIVHARESRRLSAHGPVGNSRAYALRRLRKDRPDIHARVLAGELTPHAGMTEAGLRKKR